MIGTEKGNWIELVSSGGEFARAGFNETISRVFIVGGLSPGLAYRNAKPPLPQIGEPYPDTPTSIRPPRGGVLSNRSNSYFFQAREFRADYAPGSSTDSIVTIIYAYGEDWEEKDGKTAVIWDAKSGTISKTITRDILTGAPIPGDPVLVEVGTMQIMAKLRRTNLRRIHSSLVGGVNDAKFRNLDPETVRYDGADLQFGFGNDAEIDGLHDVILSFTHSAEGWKEKRVRMDADGNPVMSGDLLVYDTFTVRRKVSFGLLFPSDVRVDPWVFA